MLHSRYTLLHLCYTPPRLQNPPKPRRSSHLQLAPHRVVLHFCSYFVPVRFCLCRNLCSFRHLPPITLTTHPCYM